MNAPTDVALTKRTSNASRIRVQRWAALPHWRRRVACAARSRPRPAPAGFLAAGSGSARISHGSVDRLAEHVSLPVGRGPARLSRAISAPGKRVLQAAGPAALTSGQPWCLISERYFRACRDRGHQHRRRCGCVQRLVAVGEPIQVLHVVRRQGPVQCARTCGRDVMRRADTRATHQGGHDVAGEGP